MKISTFATYSVLLTVLLTVNASLAFAATSYSVKSLPSIFGFSTLRAIGPTGAVVGLAYSPIDDNNRDVAVLWDTGGAIQELIPGSEAGSQAFDINTSGQVLVYTDGRVVYGNGIHIPAGVYIWQNGGLTPANLNVPFAPSTLWLAFNDSAQIMGTGDFTVGSTTQKHAFLATNGVVTDLGTLPGASASSALGINNNGDVVGYSYGADNQQRAVLWRNGSIIDLGVLAGATSSIANDINDQGVVVGSSGGRLFTWKNGVMTDLGKFSADTAASAHTINNNGDITGSANVPGTYTTAPFKWSQGVFSALNPVIQNGRCTAGDINDTGQMSLNCYYGNYVISPTTPAVDLGVLTQASQTPAVQGDPLTFTVDVYNVGSLNASNVQLNNPLPANMSFVSSSASQGSCSGNSVVSCALGNLASGAKAAVKLTVIPNVVASITNNPSVAAAEAETNTPNNTASHSVYTVAGYADLSVYMVPSAYTIKRLSNVTYTITVDNYGPAIANNAVMTDTLPSYLRLVSASTTAGSCGGSATVTCNLGNLASGAKVTIQIVAQAIKRGDSVNRARVTTTTAERVTSNNSFGVSATVK